jgi:hypothetical protein
VLLRERDCRKEREFYVGKLGIRGFYFLAEKIRRDKDYLETCIQFLECLNLEPDPPVQALVEYNKLITHLNSNATEKKNMTKLSRYY